MSDAGSGISSRTWFGRAIRWPLRLVPTQLPVPVLRGPLKGQRWIVGAGTHGCWLGTYETTVAQAFAETSRGATVVFDVGAHAGFYTLLASRAVGPRGRVVSFEPAPGNLAYLRRHLSLNSVHNVKVMPYAVADVSGTETFDDGPNRAMGSLSPGGARKVHTVTIDEIAGAAEVPAPDLIKIDVEGAEARVLLGAERTLSRMRPIVFLATHSDEARRLCSETLQRLNYALAPLGAGEWLATPRPMEAGPSPLDEARGALSSSKGRSGGHGGAEAPPSI